jgi:hypothetical protein
VLTTNIAQTTRNLDRDSKRNMEKMLAKNQNKNSGSKTFLKYEAFVKTVLNTAIVTMSKINAKSFRRSGLKYPL